MGGNYVVNVAHLPEYRLNILCVLENFYKFLNLKRKSLTRVLLTLSELSTEKVIAQANKFRNNCCPDEVLPPTNFLQPNSSLLCVRDPL